MTTDFITALEHHDLDALRCLPKADLHVHGVGAGDRDYIREQTGVSIPDSPQAFPTLAEMDAWSGEHLSPVLRLPGRLALHWEAAFAAARKDGVTRLELGTDAWEITHHGQSAKALWDALAGAHQKVAPEIDWVPQLSISRHCPARAIDYWATPLLELGVFETFDMSGDEFAQPIEVFQPIYRKAKAAGLRLKAHVGEWGTADDVWRAVEVPELDEVQHGIAAADSPQVMRALADAGVQLNVCPTSNVKLGRVASLAEHPIRTLHDAGVPVTVNTDNGLIFGCTLSGEFLGLFQAGVMNVAALDRLRLRALAEG